MLMLMLVIVVLAVALASTCAKRKWEKIVQSRVFVMPTSPSAQTFQTLLRGVDTSFFMVPDVPVVFVFREDKINFSQLYEGLVRTLNQLPIAAGRVRLGQEALEISCENSSGCLLEFIVREEEDCPPIDLPASAYIRFGIADPLIPQEPFGRPLLSATLTHFKQGCCLYVKFNHALFDGFSMVQFMHLWDQETTTPTTTTTFAMDCNHAYPTNIHIPVTKQDLASKMTISGAISFLLGISWKYYTDQVVDFEFTLEQWTQLKTELSNQLQPGEWISSYEAMMGLALQCQTNTERKDLFTKVIINIRARSALYAENYLGNALGMHTYQALQSDTAAQSALRLHDSLRTCLLAENLIELERTNAIPQQLETHRPSALWGRLLGGRLDVVERARYVFGWEQSVLYGGVIINSWVGYDWTKVQFATKQTSASFIKVPLFRSPRQLLIVPMTNSKFVLRASMRPSNMLEFKKRMLASNQPMRIV
ncbi:hypothetical protein BASA81_000737 [Batrachochytrium salamandrivorans]|nr:hypothetical protein BASA81_000737 [Batrachochytrium salamandrivorans]